MNTVYFIRVLQRLNLCFGMGLYLLSGNISFTRAMVTNQLEYAPAPPDNPLKGFVTYPNPVSDFPHSLVWNYLPLRAIMTGPASFNWEILETELDRAARQGRQFIPRLYLDFPGQPIGIPQFLVNAGVRIHTWTNYNNDPFPPAVCNTPDYNNPLLRAALTNFIGAFGAKYDRDPRLAYIPMGLLGLWGEWHNGPRNELFASKAVQTEVMDAYSGAFKYTRVLARYPAGSGDPVYSANHQRALGYHDDSFAWATMETGRASDSWYFRARLLSAGAADKWRGHPIGGEVRPEVWDCLWNISSCAPEGQEFTRCATNTHVTWLADHGLFRSFLQGEQLQRALAGARLLGYEFHVPQVVVGEAFAGAPLLVSIAITNSGIAPFYYDWTLEFGAISTNGALLASWPTSLKLIAIQPGAAAKMMGHQVPNFGLSPGNYILALRVMHPLTNGIPLRFANRTQDQHRSGWLSLCPLKVIIRPKLSCALEGPDLLRIQIHDNAAGPWNLVSSSNLSAWELAITNVQAIQTIRINQTRHFFQLQRQE